MATVSILLLIVGEAAASSAMVCNSTVELGPNSRALLESPKGEGGKSLICWYILKLAPSFHSGGLIRVEVERFAVGNLEGGECKGGRLRVEDSQYPGVNAELGEHCGEAEQEKVLVRETREMRLIFTVDKVDRRVEWLMEATAIMKTQLPERFGKMPEMFPGRVGAVVQETYCETVFQECRVQQCNVQSPGFPGIYPRGLSCRYYLSTKASLIRLYVDRPYWEAFNVDGRRCEALASCEVRELVTGAENCPYDWVRLYDGVDEYSPLIGHFCGTGSFPRSIIGTSNKLFLEFASSPAGPLLNTGFDFRVTSVPGTGRSALNGSCHQVVTSTDLNGSDDGSFISLEHWYAPGTNCSYLLRGSPTQKVRIHFEKMKMTQKTPIIDVGSECSEYLALYDSDWPDPTRVIKVFCSSFSPPRENEDFVSTGAALLVTFISRSGSYSGSSIYYWAIYDFHETKPDGEHVADTICDETIDTPMRFRSPRNSLVYKTGQNVLRVDPVDFHKESDTCADSCMGNKALDRVEVVEVVGEENVTKACLSACQPPHTTTIISLTSNLRLSLFLVGATAPSLYYTRKPPLFTAEVSYLHPPICGPTYISAVDSGFLLFPILPKGEGTHYREVECLWDLDTRPEIPISLTIGNVSLLEDDCGQHSIALAREDGEVFHTECGQTRGKTKVVAVPASRSPLQVVLKMATLNLGSVQISWQYS